MAERLAERGVVPEQRRRGTIHLTEIPLVEPMPPKDPPVGDVGSVASTPATAAVTKRPWWVAVVWCGLGCAVLLLLLGLMCFPQGHGHGKRAIRVVGRLVWPVSEEAVAGARVLAVPYFDLGDDVEDREEAWQNAVAANEEREKRIAAGETFDLRYSVYPYGGAGARSGPDGGIEIFTGVSTTTHFHGVFRSTRVGEPKRWVAALWIAPEGREPVLVRLEEGHFRQHEEGEAPSVWGTYDIGTVVVPVPENKD